MSGGLAGPAGGGRIPGKKVSWNYGRSTVRTRTPPPARPHELSAAERIPQLPAMTGDRIQVRTRTVPVRSEQAAKALAAATVDQKGTDEAAVFQILGTLHTPVDAANLETAFFALTGQHVDAEIVHCHSQDPDELAAAIAPATVVVMAWNKIYIGEAIMAQAPVLRLIQKFSAPYEDVDVAAATARGIVLTVAEDEYLAVGRDGPTKTMAWNFSATTVSFG